MRPLPERYGINCNTLLTNWVRMGPKSINGTSGRSEEHLAGIEMAVGAVFISLPMALLIALYGFVVQGASAGQGLLLYITIGTAIMMTFTFLNAAAFADQR